LIIVATIPAIIVGFAFERALRHLFGSLAIAAGFLIVNGLVLFAAERLKRKGGRSLDGLTWSGAFAIGVWQCTAFIPGISRSGATMAGGLLAGMHHRDAARFSFLIATPVIGGRPSLKFRNCLAIRRWSWQHCVDRRCCRRDLGFWEDCLSYALFSGSRISGPRSIRILLLVAGTTSLMLLVI